MKKIFNILLGLLGIVVALAICTALVHLLALFPFVVIGALILIGIGKSTKKGNNKRRNVLEKDKKYSKNFIDFFPH